MNSPKVIFAGTPEFALAPLQALVASDIRPVAVLTQPDRPAGRGKQLTASPVKQYAADQGIDVLQPDSLRDDEIAATLQALQADIMVVAAYGLILPQRVLDIPGVGCLNIHASLLPRWRGAAPIQAAILAGDQRTGVSLMSMTAGLDCGPVFVSKSLQIGERETAGELHDRLAAAGSLLLVQHLADIVAGNLPLEQQDDARATYAPKIRTSDAKINWQEPADKLVRLVRAFNPVPGAYFMLDDERIKCWSASSAAPGDAPAGTIVAAGPGGIQVACGAGTLCMQSLQRPGKRRVTAAQFVTNIDIVGRRL